MVTAVETQNAALIAARDKAIASGQTSKTTAEAAQTQLSSDVNFFLKMLTTQLKNQDPTSPMDTAQFTAQIAQYSGVQQQVVTNSNLEKLLANSKQSSASTAVSYIGKEVESTGKSGLVVGGQGAFSYILPKTAGNVDITITDSAGRTVFTGKGTKSEGRNLVIWDGKNSTTTNQEPDGIYNIAVKATDAAGNEMKTETRSVTIVTGVETDTDGSTLLTSGLNKVELLDVLAVRDPTRAVIQDPDEDDSTT